MSILVPSINSKTKSSGINVKIGELINSTLSKIFTFISVSKVNIKGIENFEKGKSYLIVANHPAFVDGFLMRELFSTQNVAINGIMHNGLLETKFLGDYLKNQGHIGVLSKRSTQYYLKKGFSLEKAKSRFESRFLKSKIVNREAFKRSTEILQSHGNLFIFITGAGYLDLEENPEIYNGYKKIVTDYLKTSNSIDILPITIEFSNGYKNASFPIRNEVSIQLLPSISANNGNLEDVYKEIELIYNPGKKDV